MSFGTLQFSVLTGSEIKLNQGKEFYLVMTPPPGCTRTGALRTLKKPATQLDWNYSESIVLTGMLPSKPVFKLALLQFTTLFADSCVGSGAIDLTPLLSGQPILDVEYTLVHQKQEVAKVTVAVQWKGDPPSYVAGAAAGAGPADAAVTGATAAGAAAQAAQLHIPLPPPEGQEFSVRIRLHKARNLQSLKEDKLYNPMVVVSCCGRTAHSETISSTNEPIWDEEKVFTINNASEKFWREVITITVVNSRLGIFNETIGLTDIDCGTVYRSSPTHSMARKWFVLRKSSTEGSVMGFLKASLCILNLRTDNFPTESEDRAAEQEDDDNEENIISNLISSPGAVFDEFTLFVDVIKATGIPKMDSGLHSTADPYVKVIFNRSVEKTVTVKNTLNPIWNSQISLPLMLPSPTDAIKLQLWDWDMASPDDLIGTVSLQLAKLVANGDQAEGEGLPMLPLQWINFYGHPRACDADYNGYFKAMAKGERKGIDYRGRLLLRMLCTRGVSATKPPPPSLRECMVDVQVTLQLMLFNMITNSGKYRARVSFGAAVASTTAKHTESMHGTNNLYAIYFGEEMHFTARIPIVPPETATDATVVDQLPDVIIQLVEDSAFSLDFFTGLGKKQEDDVEPYASVKFRTEKILGSTEPFYQCKALRPSKDPTSLNEGAPPSNPVGQIYCSMFIKGCTPQHPGVKTATGPLASGNFISNLPIQKYILDCYVYHAHNLPAGDASGLSDPFIRIIWGNCSECTGTRLENLNPCYYETVRVIADGKPKFSDIIIEIWDWDMIGHNTFLCKTVVPYDTIVDAQGYSSPEAKWHRHFTNTYGDNVGAELLLGFQLMPASTEALKMLPDKIPVQKKLGSSKEVYMATPIPRNRMLASSKYLLTFTLFGLEKMRKFRLRDIQAPSVDATVGNFAVTFGKRLAKDLEFNAQATLVLELPENPEHLPNLNLYVYDHRIGPKVLLGSATLPLNLDWCKPAAKAKKRAEDDARAVDILSKVEKAKAARIGAAVKDPEGWDFVDAAGSAPGLASPSSPMRQAAQTGDLQQPLLTESAVTGPYRPTASAVATAAQRRADEKKSAHAIDEELKQLTHNARLVPDTELPSGAASPATTEAEEEHIWFDRFDPEGIAASLSASQVVSRLGHLNILPPGQTTAEDYFGPFDDGTHSLTLHRGWGKDRMKTGIAVIDLAVSKANEKAEPTKTPNLVSIPGRKVQPFVLRVYIIQCRNLAAMDDGLLGKMSDPYVVLRLCGGPSNTEIRVKCSDDTKYQTLDPEYFFMREMHGTLPTHSRLVVTVMDYDKIGRDEEIGSTEVNLSNRWFSSRGYQTRQSTILAPGSYTESRPLRNSLGLLQGTIEMWVDMFSEGDEAPPIPRPIDVTPPPPVELELRVMIWNARDVTLVDTSIHGEAMCDMYIRCWLDGMRDNTQNTDVHYRSLDGSGNFNWRMVYPLVFEPRTKKIYPVNSKTNVSSLFHIRKEQKKFVPMLHLQIFDNDLLPGTDDFVGEANIGLLQANPTTTHRKQQSILGEVVSDVKDVVSVCCKCCHKDEGKRRLTLEEKRQIAIQEAQAERKAREKIWNEAADLKIETLRQTKRYSEDQLKAMRRTLIKEAKKASTVNVFEPFVPHKAKKNALGLPIKEEHPQQVETGKFWFACHGPFGGGRVGDVQISFQLVRRDAIENDSALAVGRGRSEPNALPDPKRPDSSFFWLSSPWKAAVHILWKNYKWYFFTVVCLVVLVLAMYLFLGEGVQVKARSFFT